MIGKIHLDIEKALDALGELLTAEGTEFGIVVLGGAALNLLGIVERTLEMSTSSQLRHPLWTPDYHCLLLLSHCLSNSSAQ
jgi:hypothetical protein